MDLHCLGMKLSAQIQFPWQLYIRLSLDAHQEATPNIFRSPNDERTIFAQFIFVEILFFTQKHT